MKKSDVIFYGIIIGLFVFLVSLNIGGAMAERYGANLERAKWTCTKRIVSSGVCVEQVRKGAE